MYTISKLNSLSALAGISPPKKHETSESVELVLSALDDCRLPQLYRESISSEIAYPFLNSLRFLYEDDDYRCKKPKKSALISLIVSVSRLYLDKTVPQQGSLKSRNMGKSDDIFRDLYRRAKNDFNTLKAVKKSPLRDGLSDRYIQSLSDSLSLTTDELIKRRKSKAYVNHLESEVYNDLLSTFEGCRADMKFAMYVILEGLCNHIFDGNKVWHTAWQNQMLEIHVDRFLDKFRKRDQVKLRNSLK